MASPAEARPALRIVRGSAVLGVLGVLSVVGANAACGAGGDAADVGRPVVAAPPAAASADGGLPDSARAGVGSGSPAEDGGAPPESGAESRPSPCPSSPWSFYGHDAARTSASDGCAEGPLTITWRFTRKGLCGYKFRPGRVVSVVGDASALFAALSCGGSPAVMRVSPSGEPGWTFSRADFGRGTWPALVDNGVLSTDDGVFLVDRESGTWHGRELDVWGEPLAMGDAFYVDNTFQLDGAGPFVAALDRSLKWRWRASEISVGKGKKVPRIGGVAGADGLIVHAAARGVRGLPSIAAYDAQTGARRWTAKGTWPASAPSIADGRVFAVEQWTGEKTNRLVARTLADGSVAWSARTPWARGPAPVIGGKYVLLHLADGVRAYDRATGALGWSHASPRLAPSEENATTMAVAAGSGTVVVTAGPRLAILKLDDGTEQWSDALVSGSSPSQGTALTLERPIVIGRSVYVVSDGALLRLDPRNAKKP